MNAIRDFLAIPFGWALGWFYDLSGNYLLSLVVITLAVRLLLLYPSIKQQKSSAKQMRLQAKVNKIKAKYAGGGRENQMKISEETQELYKREGFSASTAGCLPLLIQLPVMIGLYGAIYAPLTKVLHMPDSIVASLKSAYLLIEGAVEDAFRIELNILNKFTEVVANLDSVQLSSIGQPALDRIQDFINKFTIFGINLTETPNTFKEAPDGYKLLIIPVLAGITALLPALLTYMKQRKTNPEMAKNPAMGCMTFMSPMISVVFAYTLPAGVGFYWIVSNIVSLIQTVALTLMYKPADVIAQQMIDETVERRSKENSIKARRAIIAAHSEDSDKD